MTDVQRFTVAVDYWVQKFGLHDWAIMVHEDDLGSPGPQAKVIMGWDSRFADVIWNKQNGDDLGESMSPERLALHEVLHILICDLTNVQRSGSKRAQGGIAAAEHAFIHRMMRVLMPLSSNKNGRVIENPGMTEPA